MSVFDVVSNPFFLWVLVIFLYRLLELVPDGNALTRVHRSAEPEVIEVTIKLPNGGMRVMNMEVLGRSVDANGRTVELLSPC